VLQLVSFPENDAPFGLTSVIWSSFACCGNEGKFLNTIEKIKVRLDDLAKHLIAGDHLKSAEGVVVVLDMIASITKFTSVLSDEERDFINAARMAVNDKKEWK
jgi:hypothetical protein